MNDRAESNEGGSRASASLHSDAPADPAPADAIAALRTRPGWQLAVHEAGHAVMAFALGWTVDVVSIEPDVNGVAFTYATPSPPNDDLRCCVRQKLAGRAAVWVETGCGDLQVSLDGVANDFDVIAKWFRDQGTKEDEVIKMVVEEDRVAVALLLGRRSQLQALAHAVLDKRRLEKDSVRAILEGTAHQ